MDNYRRRKVTQIAHSFKIEYNSSDSPSAWGP